jgi:hypothetical protein
MNPGRIQDPEGAKTVIISFKRAVEGVAAIHRQTCEIVRFKNTSRGRLRVDEATTKRGKWGPAKHDRRSILIYKPHMYTEASLDPERCIIKTDQQARNKWVANHVR